MGLIQGVSEHNCVILAYQSAAVKYSYLGILIPDIITTPAPYTSLHINPD